MVYSDDVGQISRERVYWEWERKFNFTPKKKVKCQIKIRETDEVVPFEKQPSDDP